MKKEKDNSKKVLLKGTAILSVAGLLSKILSAVYRVPFQNIVGDVGFYIYQQVYPFYGIAVSFATYGFPVVISKLYAEKISIGDTRAAKKILFPAFVSVSTICLLIFLVIYFGSTFFSRLMGDPRLEPLLKMVSLTFLIIPLVSVMRGHFQGQGFMAPTAISQLGEQIVRVSLILILAFLLTAKGFTLYVIGKWTMFASVVGSLCGAMILVAFFIHYNHQSQIHFWNSIKGSVKIMKMVWTEGIAVCISSLTLLLFQLADSFQMVPLLKESGMALTQAQVMKGIYDRGQPLVQLGMVLAISLSLSVVPFVAAMKRKSEEMTGYIRFAFQLSLVVSSAATTGLILIMNDLNVMLFENEWGSNVLRIFVLIVFFATICTTIISVLQGLDITYFPACIVIVGFFVKLLFNRFFILKWGTMGAAIASNLALLLMAVILIYRLRKTIDIRLVNWRFVIVLIKSLTIMTITISLFFLISRVFAPLFHGVRLFSAFVAICAAVIGAIVFFISIIRGRIFSKEEIILLPFGSRLQFLLKEGRVNRD
ncbi:polysaccharide biosynthesis protein [Caldifermentibacillus hisashii]|uniref:putative polysaccharide biosynthesis protein n=1 Tax=Caldifermentibacillus hisashii TaxID=996558 RepID=UPI0031FDA28A